MLKRSASTPPEPAQLAVAQGRIAYSVGRLDRVLRQRIGQATERFGMTVAQYTALSVLHARGQLSNAQLARRSFISPQAANEMIQAMAAKRLVVQKPDPQHGRIVQISLTAAGERLLRQCDAAVQEVEDEMLEKLSSSESTALRRLLQVCIASLEERQTAAAE